MRSTSDDEIDQQLIDHYEDFQENLYRIQNMNNTIDFQWISLLAWLKYYAQIYAIALNNESHRSVMSRIDRLLTNVDSPFSSTLKLFIFKQLRQISELTLDDYLQHSQQNLRLPIPLFECREEFQRFNQILHQNDKIDDLRELVHECNRSQNLSYSFLCWFIQYYCHFMQVNIEESVFDRALRADVKAELQKTTFTDDECQRVIKQFSHDAFEKQTISPLLKNIDRWISMLKRLMIRILNTNIELDERLQVYLERTYLWSDPITDADLATFQIDNDILHRHTYVILYALE
ncbi:unnamed protein product [Rotaria sp. Silwood1]|nr:unnamed protein product [Rotaria sp. Silwood1]